MSEQMNEDQSIVGATRHSQTGAYIVWVSLDGNDVTPVGAFTSKSVADEVVQETAGEFHRLLEAMEAAAPGDAEEAGTQHWVDFLQRMEAKSDAKTTPFPQAQLAQIGQIIVQLLRRRQSVPDKPDGFTRVLIYSPDALAGNEMPRVRLVPMERSAKGSKGKKPKTAPVQATPAASLAPIYLSYTHLPGAAPYFQMLDGEEAFTLIRESAKAMGHQATVVRSRGKATDPTLEVVCITDGPLSQGGAETVSQAAVNYAMDAGLIAKRYPNGGPSL